MADQVALPEGQDSFKLNEVCKLANVQPYMLRFWGTEFEQLEASKSGTGQRLYTRDQVELILEIRRLLFDEGLTIAGARKRIGTSAGGAKPSSAKAPKQAPEEKAAEPEPAAEEAPAEPPPAPARTAAKGDKAAAADAQPLVATLKSVRSDLADIVADLKK